MIDSSDASTDSQRALAEENRKLRKINRVLMNRVEREMDAQGGTAFSLFQTAITLENRISERTAELTRLTHRLMQEISERRAAEEAMRAAKAEAEQANLSKTKFLAAASHDLHQPLNAARLFLGALAAELHEPKNQALVSRIEAALETMGDLLNVLLDISKLDAGVWPVSMSSFAIGPVLERLRHEYAAQADALSLELRLVPSNALVHSDRRLFERVMRNLISNALRYTGVGRILIGCRHRPDGLRVEVWDTGVGIPEADRDRIFGEFERLGGEARRHDKGLGLGLAIVERVSRLLGLDVEVCSCVGRGSCFSVRLDYARDNAIADPGQASLSWLPVSLQGKCIAVVENDEPVLEGMQSLLSSWGCVVVPATSSAEALAVLAATGREPDAIVADYHLHDEIGTDAIARIRWRFGREVPALVVSGDRSRQLEAEIKALGFAFLAKPTPPAKMRAMLTSVLGRAEQ